MERMRETNKTMECLMEFEGLMQRGMGEAQEGGIGGCACSSQLQVPRGPNCTKLV